MIKRASLSTIERIEAEYNLTDPRLGNERISLIENIVWSSLGRIFYLKEKKDLLKRNQSIAKMGALFRMAKYATTAFLALTYPEGLKYIAFIYIVPTALTRDLIHATWKNFQEERKIKKITGLTRQQIFSKLFNVKDMSPIHIHSLKTNGVNSFVMVKRESFGYFSNLFLDLLGIELSHPYVTRGELEAELRRTLSGGQAYVQKLRAEASSPYHYTRLLLEAASRYIEPQSSFYQKIVQASPVALRQTLPVNDHIWSHEQWHFFDKNKYKLTQSTGTWFESLLNQNMETRRVLQASLSEYRSTTKITEGWLNAYETLGLKLMAEINLNEVPNEETLERRNELRRQIETSQRSLALYHDYFVSETKRSQSLRSFRCQMSVNLSF